MNRHSNPKQNAAWAALVTAAAVCLALAPALAAQQVADVRAGGSGIDFLPLVEHGGLVLTVSGPEGFHHRAEFGAGEAPSFSIFDRAGGALADGSYNWELRANPTQAQRRAALEANQRAPRSGGIERLVQSGTFAVLGGAIVAGGATEAGQQPEAAGPELALRTDILTVNDATIIQSVCVGIDCTSSENFGFDTVRLKENNTRIKFQDTSVGTFPSVDWQLTANDSTNGGQNRFSIDDIDNARTPFTIEAAAPSHSLYVDDGGRIGMGTSTPVVEIHVVDGDTPTLRLEQDGSSGFTAQSYDVAANETNFFVRDNTTGSKLPFRLRPGAPTSSIDVASNGNVGMGTQSPQDKLHIASTADPTNGQLFVQNTSGTAALRTMVNMQNNGGIRWLMGDRFEVRFNNNQFQFDNTTNPGIECSIDNVGNLSCLGTKNFSIPDPADPSMKIVFAALEGPEAGTYYRGTAKLVDGEASIELPDFFGRVTEAEGLTVQLTSLGGWHKLYVVEKSTARLVIRDAEGADGVEFDFLVHGIRKGYKDFQVLRPGGS